MKRKGIWKLLLALLMILMVPFWVSIVAPFFTNYSEDFSYEADLLSIDNFYDEEQNAFAGSQVSRTEFNYNVVDVREDVLLVENVFDVFTFDGDEIISLRNINGIDKVSGKHVYGYGDRNRTGYLFAPKYLEKEQNFDYWHVNYNAPAKLEYVGEDYVGGLKTYKYETFYENFDIDQTDSLTNLEGVPEEKGVVLEPSLQIWFEPITGLMVKYKDDTTAYFYDIETGERLQPWNKFVNEFTESSIVSKVAEITMVKYKFLIVDYGVPILFGIMALILIGSFFRRRYLDKRLNIDEIKKNKFIIVGFVFVVGVLFSTLFYQYQVLDLEVKTEFTVGIPMLNQSETVERSIQIFKQRLERNGFVEGENITYIEVEEPNRQEFVKLVRRMISEDNVDLLYGITTSANQMIKNETRDIPIVFNFVTHPLEVGLIDSYESSGNNLVGVRYYVPIDGLWYEVDNLIGTNPSLNFDRLVLIRGDINDNSKAQSDEVRDYFRSRPEEFVELVISGNDDINGNYKESIKNGDIVFVTCDSSMNSYGSSIVEVADQNDVPVISCLRGLVEDGALLSVDVDIEQVSNIAGDKAALLLQGANPTWMKTELPASNSLNLNKGVAERYGLEVPNSILDYVEIYFDEE